MENNVLSIYDYVICIMMLAASSGIGIYFGCFGTKQNTVKQYLYGNKDLSAIPVGLSIYSSAVSAIALIGQPSEVYVFGTQLTVGSFGAFLSLGLIWWVILPVFCGNLNMSSPYEYFERRFNSKVRVLVSVVYIINTMIFVPIIIYASILSITKISGLQSWICILVIGGVCIFYTMLGGIQSVIWTDTLQATVMVITLIVVSVVGTSKVGSFADVWRIANEGGRIQIFDMNPDPFVRTSFWSTFIGLMFLLGSQCCTSASALQRYMSLKTESQARISTFIGISGMVMMFLATCAMGLAMYAYYAGCDPVKSNIIKNSNDLVPHFIIQISKDMPGLVGFFVAGFLSACLSTISSELNVTSALLYYDILTKVFGKKINRVSDVIIIKILVLILGVVAMGVVPLLEKSKYIFQLVISTSSFAHGVRFGMLLLGMLFPMANSMGAFFGCIASICLVMWTCLGALYYNVNSYYALPTSIDKCNFNTTIGTILQNITNIMEEKPSGFKIYHLSFCYYTFLGTMIIIVVGLVVSYLTGKNNNVEPSLIAPFLRSRLKT